MAGDAHAAPSRSPASDVAGEASGWFCPPCPPPELPLRPPVELPPRPPELPLCPPVLPTWPPSPEVTPPVLPTWPPSPEVSPPVPPGGPQLHADHAVPSAQACTPSQPFLPLHARVWPAVHAPRDPPLSWISGDVPPEPPEDCERPYNASPLLEQAPTASTGQSPRSRMRGNLASSDRKPNAKDEETQKYLWFGENRTRRFGSGHPR